MTEKAKIIPNKYDMHTVETRFNEFLSENIEKMFKTKKSEASDNFKLIFGAVMSVVILSSYFHKTPFPEDKPLIAVCLILYHVLGLLMKAYNDYVLKGAFSEFTIVNKNIPPSYTGLKSKDNKPMKMRLKSKVAEYSNRYALEVMLDDKTSLKTVEYNDYITEDGYLVEDKLKAMLKGILNEL